MSQLIYLENCFSTNDEIINLINDDESTAVFTFNQTKGRGQYGNIWKVNPNQNLAYHWQLEMIKSIFQIFLSIIIPLLLFEIFLTI
jgi:BirA family biotin operon repressor/biotin-[acetyl-CoA-carboxylase] ligase